MSFIEDLQNLNPEDPGGWPPLFKGLAAALVIIIILAAGYFLKLKDEWAALESKRGEEITLKQEFERKQQKAANLEAYREQLAEMQEIFDSMKRQLPSKTEIPNLLQDISQTALATGIRVERFQPQPENVKDFYAEKPISLKMVGSYHQFGEFVSGVASLSRVVILTMHDISLKPVNDDPSELALDGVVKTYRYVDATEAIEQGVLNEPFHDPVSSRPGAVADGAGPVSGGLRRRSVGPAGLYQRCTGATG